MLHCMLSCLSQAFFSLLKPLTVFYLMKKDVLSLQIIQFLLYPFRRCFK